MAMASTWQKAPSAKTAIEGWEGESAAEVKEAFGFLLTAVTALQNAGEKANWVVENVGKDPELGKVMNDPKLATAPQTIASWFQTTCGVTVTLAGESQQGS